MKTVLITGSSSGIGKATAEYFLRKGWQVAATMRTPGNSTLEANDRMRIYELDVTKPDSIQSALESAIAHFGRIDVLVNNAGYGVDGVFEAMDDDTLERQYKTNVLGLMRVTRALIPHMRGAGGGSIIQVSSMGGRITLPFYSVYHGTKWAVEGFSESLRYELEPLGIRVKIVEPGAILTEFYSRSAVTVMPEDMHQLYGAMYSKWQARFAGFLKFGVKPERVAKTIYRASISRSGRIRYPSGFPAPILLAFHALVPVRLFNWAVRQTLLR